MTVKPQLFGALLALLCAVPGLATPIRPNLQQILAEPPRNQSFAPARAGWNGPEMVPPQAEPNPTLEAYGFTASRQASRAALLALVVPDARAVLAIAGAIVLMRLAKRLESQRRNPKSNIVAMPPPASREQNRQAA